MFSNEETEFLKANYPTRGKAWCCEALNKPESAIRTMAAKLKLRIDRNSEFFKEFQDRAKNSKIGKKRPEHSELMKAYAKDGRLDGFIVPTDEKNKIISEKAKKRIAENGHPKGMKGKKHSPEIATKAGERLKALWQDPNSVLNSDEHRQLLSDRATKVRSELKGNPNNYSRVQKGTVMIGGKTFFARSSWEANIAAYYEFLKTQNKIKDWEHEPETFWFEEIRRGVRSYLPDFKITDLDESFFYVEVKGWMDAKSVTKIKRMALYYPKVKLDIIDQTRYKAIAKNAGIIPYWGILSQVQETPAKKACKVDNCPKDVHSKFLCRGHFYQVYKR